MKNGLPACSIPSSICRHLAVILLLTPLALLPARAALDSNSNGVSDIWELDTNSGQLFTIFDPAADDDGDGWTNAQEEAAGTLHSDPNPPAGYFKPDFRIAPAVYVTGENGEDVLDTPESFVLTFTGLPGKLYTVQHSPDLIIWTTLDDPILCDGTAVEAGQPVADGPKYFFRVTIADIDRDQDGLTDWEEFKKRTNPIDSDTDHDQIGDLAELKNTNLYDPLVADQDQDGILDGLDLNGMARTNNAEASPDTAGLISATTGQATALLTSMIGRWDFESTTTATPQFGFPNIRFPDSGPSGYHASPYFITAPDPEGIISKAVRAPATGGNGFLTLPNALLNNRAYYTVAFWARIEQNAGSGFSTNLAYGLFGHHNYASYPPYLDVNANGMWLTKSPDGKIHLHAGTLNQTNHLDDMLINLVTTPAGVDKSYNPGELDDGRWRHYVLVRNNAVTILYINGALAGSETHTVASITPNTDAGISLGRLAGPAPGSVATQSGTQPVVKGSYDRLRVWPSVLTAADAATLFHEDADHDGLWDITEAASSLWRDTNSDAIRTPDEVAFYVNPFRYDPPTKDHDRDGILSINEQTLGSGIYDADSDDDGIPDGYDQTYCLGALVKDLVLTTDADGDGLTLASEVSYGTNPNVADTDTDDTSDGVEAAQNGLPNDASDQGQPPAPGAVLSLRLAVGDESGSDSEDYHLVVYRYDPETHAETEVYRLRSGGFGKYSGDQVVSCFRQDQQYTVRIQWQGSRLTSRNAAPGVTAEGPDFDYTMKVEPAQTYPGLVIEDAIKPATGDSYPGRTLLGVMGDVTDFPVVSYDGAVKLTKTYIDLAVDSNNDGRIDSLPDDAPDTYTKTLEGALPLDRTYSSATPPRAVVIDVNNDNDNGDGVVDYDNQQIDSITDRNQLDGGFAGGTTRGHTLGKLRVWAMPTKHIADGKLALRLSFPNAADANIVRVFDWQNNGHKYGDKPVELLGPGTPDKVVLDKTLYLTGLPTVPKDAYRDLVMEGLTYGTATLKLELFEVATNNVISSEEVKVTVNVDQYARTGDDLANCLEAISLRGKAPHYLGIRGMPVGGTTGFLRAVRGRITCRVPSYNLTASSRKSHLSPMHDPRKLRFRSGEKDMGQSLWIGIKQNLPNGGLTWVQCGLRWFQAPDMAYPSPPLGYLETGTFLQSAGIAHTPKCASPGSGGYGADSYNIAALQGWESAPLVLDFVMWKALTYPDEPEAANAGEWHVIFKDARIGKDPTHASTYLHLHAGAATPQKSPAQRAPYDDAYNMQKLNILDANLESTNSISFAPGTSGQKASISELRGAALMAEGVNPNLSPSEWPDLWTWLGNAYQWENLTPPAGTVKAEIRTGRNTDGDAEIGTVLYPHPNWKFAPIPHGVELWDDRPFGFATQP